MFFRYWVWHRKFETTSIREHLLITLCKIKTGKEKLP
jgi:hypothetical protein